MYLSTKSVLEAKWFQNFKHQRLIFFETEKYQQTFKIFYVTHILHILTINISTNNSI